MCMLRAGTRSKKILELLENLVHKIRIHMEIPPWIMQQQHCKDFLAFLRQGGSPHFWTAISEVIFNCVDEDLTGFLCQSPQNMVSNEHHEDAFVDETGLVVDDRVEILSVSYTTMKKYMRDICTPQVVSQHQISAFGLSLINPEKIEMQP